MTTALMIIVALTALATITLWREAVRRPERPSKKFIKALLRSEPIVPKHGTPTRWTFEDDAYVAKYERTSLGTMFRAQRSFFHDFADFAVVVNSWFKQMRDCWRLQELADNELQLFTQDSPPEFGRRYSIFYNQTDLGVLEMRHGYDYSDESPVVLAELELHSVRLLQLTAIQSLLQGIAMHVSDFQREGTEQTAARAAIEQAILQVLWATQHVSQYPPELSETDWGELECRLILKIIGAWSAVIAIVLYQPPKVVTRFWDSHSGAALIHYA
jgi:hypothetical protein